MRGFIHRRDYNLMRRANNWEAPQWIRFYAMAATRAGDGWLWFAIGLAVLFLGGSERFAALSAAGLSAVVSVLLFQWLKRFTGRRRPCEIEPHRWATLLPPDQFSFPSGHTMTAFAVAVSLSLFYPSIMVGLLFCAFSIAASRILLGMHFLSDVMAGAIIGGLIGSIGYAVFQ